ncbi:MAG: secondary thiamine-phosphate synthase enzyme YjbQ [Candidatus Cybelea sp.]
MKSVLKRVTVQTQADTQMINVTDDLKGAVAESGVRQGVAYVTTMHTTTGITINECLPDVEDDVIGMLKRLAPTDDPTYRHARFLPSDGGMAVNSHCHQRAAILGPQVAFPIEEGEVVLGARQTVYFVELDGPLMRNFVIHVIGEED